MSNVIYALWSDLSRMTAEAGAAKELKSVAVLELRANNAGTRR